MNVYNCPEWRYAAHARRAELLTAATADVLTDLRLGRIDSLASSLDTRPLHARMFTALAPRGFEYYAGHYRGEDFPCLKLAGVRFGERRGALPAVVADRMASLADVIREGVDALDEREVALQDARPESVLLTTVILVSRLFVSFLEVHPYRDGNGHAARLIVWAIMMRYGYYPNRFTVEPRPGTDEYIDLIEDYRSGNTTRLETYILQCLA